METNHLEQKPRKYILEIDTRLEEFPYAVFHIYGEGNLFIYGSEILPGDVERLQDLKIRIDPQTCIYHGVCIYQNVTICEGCILNRNATICPDVVLQPGSYVEESVVVCVNPPSRWTKLFRRMGYFLGRFSPFKAKNPSDE